jgi:hypothetical protein
MKRSDLKKMLKPIVQECIRESLYDSGLLSSIISEVIQGVNAGQGVIKESQAPVRATPKVVERDNSANLRAKEKKAQIHRAKKNLLDSIGKDAYNGVDLFEGTTPLRSAGSPSATPSSTGPMSGIDPGDPGVNIDALTESLGNTWKKLAAGGKK